MKRLLGEVVCLLGLLALPSMGFAQTHTMPGSNVVPSGASLTIQSGGSITAAAGSTVTGFGAGGGGNVSNSGTPTAGQKATWVDATHIQGVTDNALQWDGGATGLTAATGRTSLGLVIGVNVQAYDADLDGWAAKTPYAGTVTVTTGKTFNCTGNLTLSGTDGSTLNMGAGGTLGTAAYTASTAYQAADSDLTTWAGITPVAAVGTWIATPSSANLRAAVSDENGTGTLLFSGATTPDFTTGFTIGAAAASGKILVGNGTNFVPSTPTYPNTASPTARKFIVSDGTNWVASTETQATPGTSGNVLKSDGTNWTSAAPAFGTRISSQASNATWAPNADTTDVFVLTLQAAAVTVISNPSGTPVDGQRLMIRAKCDGTNRALTWSGTDWRGSTDIALPTTLTASKTMYLGFVRNTTDTKWDLIAKTDGF